MMAATTPNAVNHAGLADLASRYVDVGCAAWTPTRFKGVEIKVLMETGDRSPHRPDQICSRRELPDHEQCRDRAEFRYCRGSLVDGEGAATPRQPCVAPAGSRHDAFSGLAAWCCPSSSSPTSSSTAPARLDDAWRPCTT
jgi:hypothetical protein